MEDISLIKLYKNNFNLALIGEDPRVSKYRYDHFLKQLPNEFFRQTTSSTEDISFVSSVKVELINCCQEVKKDISDKFAYNGFQDRFGVQQITFEFGFIGEDFWTETLYLKITDLVNSNIWYSSPFLITGYESEQTTEVCYGAKSEIYGVDYDLAKSLQVIRLNNVYFKQPNDEEQTGQYIDTQGGLNKFKTIHTPYDEYKIEKMNTFIYRRLQRIFAHHILYVDGFRSTLKDGIKKGDIQGQSNFFDGSFLVNKNREKYIPTKEFLPTLKLVSSYPKHHGIYTLNSIQSDFFLEFNLPIDVVFGTSVMIYFNNIATQTIVGVVDNNKLLLDFSSYAFVNGNFKLTLLPNQVFSGDDYFNGLGLNDLNFEIKNGDYSKIDYSNDYFRA